MARRFNPGLAAAGFLLLFPVTVFAAESQASQTQPNSEALEMIAKRMRSLTQSLEGMPEPPAFKQKIQLPDEILTPRQRMSETENKGENS